MRTFNITLNDYFYEKKPYLYIVIGFYNSLYIKKRKYT